MKLTEIAQLLKLPVRGDRDPEIKGIAHPAEATSEDLVYVETSSFLEAAVASDAGAFLVSDAVEIDDSRPRLIASHGPASFVRLLQLFERPRQAHPAPQGGIRQGIGCRVAESAVIEPGAVLGNHVTLESDVFIGANCVLGDDVTICEGTTLDPGVFVGHSCTIGKDCRLQSGSVIGSDGFGYLDHQGERHRYPHLGRVVLEDRVEVGANATIDRSVLGTTRIGCDTKIDNLVQVAHNCTIGSYCYLVAQSGVAGSCTLGDGVTLAGQAGISDHIRVGDGAVIVGKSAVRKHVDAGQIVGGVPAFPIRIQNEFIEAIPRIPGLVRKLESMNQETGSRPSPDSTPWETVVLQLLADNLRVSTEEIGMKTDLKDRFGADSLTILTFVTELETRFDLEIPDEAVRAMRTPSDILEYLERHL